MPTDPIRTWTLLQIDHDAPNHVDGPVVRRGEPVRVADAAAVAAALDRLAEHAIDVLVEVNRLREAVSGE